ncbi:carboxymuconolactone decarboxylase family protein [Amycolatopsis sp. cg5]|uniref:carboxymuconolactone decarboxylase family protein n=1 Tax=Amycolatopsis sp. cg5 TaxID=3238802 RepID=UPI003526ABCC
MSDETEKLHRRGRANFAELVEGGEQRLDALFQTIPALGELAVGTVYGHLHERPGLDPRIREAATLAAIVAAGMTGPPLSVHLKTGLASGLAPGEVTEVVLQTAAFAGFPRAVSAADQLNRLFADAGLTSPPARTPREVVLAYCVAPPEDAEPDVLALLTEVSRVSATATGPDRVLVECFGDDSLDGVLVFRVEGENVVEVGVYRQAD